MKRIIKEWIERETTEDIHPRPLLEKFIEWLNDQHIVLVKSENGGDTGYPPPFKDRDDLIHAFVKKAKYPEKMEAARRRSHENVNKEEA